MICQEIKQVPSGRQSPEPSDVVYLLDVDNTLLDNDRVEQDLRQFLVTAFGVSRQTRYWQIFEEIRAELGYADYLGALQRYRTEHLNDPHMLGLSRFLLDYPFADRLYDGAIDVVAYLRRQGPTVLLTDGDVVFQPHKIERSGLWQAVDGHALVYIHKEQMLNDVSARYPARHYVMVDDKPRILGAMKAVWGSRLTTIFVRQGHYALESTSATEYPPADLTIECIEELRGIGHPIVPT